MWLNGEGLKQAMYGGFRNAAGLGGLPYNPMRASRWLARKGRLSRIATRSSRTQFVRPDYSEMSKPRFRPYRRNSMSSLERIASTGFAGLFETLLGSLVIAACNGSSRVLP